jgi:hypothetical protein
MNKTNLKRYAPQARKDFIAAVTARAQLLGLTEVAGQAQAAPCQVNGDVAVIAGRPWPASVQGKRERLFQRMKHDGYAITLEAVAYTWFNRFAALRYLELHDYLGHGRRVLSNPDGALPEVLGHAVELAEAGDLPGLQVEQVRQLKLDNQDGELFRRVLIAQCNALHGAMPFLFEAIDDETELLLPDNLLLSDSVVAKLVSGIPDEDWSEVEAIGWLYQFYISEKKDQVIGKVVKSEDIPAATQLFTPNWIVQYLVQNSVGRLWLMANPSSTLASEWPYYIEPAEQTPEVQAQLDALIQTRIHEDGEALNPETITVMDPACGSGHILVVAYDVLKAIYLERGYQPRTIPRLILEKNLYGLDIDDRAAQLAAFALLMKARADDRRLFNDPPTLNVLSLQESKGLDVDELATRLAPFGLRRTPLKELVDTFEHAKTFGSLIQIPAALNGQLAAMTAALQLALQDGDLYAQQAAKDVLPLARQALVLGMQFDALVTNPPYMGLKGMNPELKLFARDHFPSGKSDLFAAFIQRGLGWCKSVSISSMVTMQSWMFLSSYEELRKDLLARSTISTFLHVGYNSFPEINSKVAQACAFSLLASGILNATGRYVNLNSADQSADKGDIFRGRNQNLIHDVPQGAFLKISGAPISYWISDRFRTVISESKCVGDVVYASNGVQTGDNERFVRRWAEVDSQKVGNDWIFYNKGGDFRKWYGNNDLVVEWRNGGQSIKSQDNCCIRGEDYYFKEGITWSDITSGDSSFRFFPENHLFDAKGPSAFPVNAKFEYLIALLNSKVTSYCTRILNPTLSFQIGDLRRLPYKEISEKSRIETLAKIAIDLSRNDWDGQEQSHYFCGINFCVEASTRGLAQDWLQSKKKSDELVAKLKSLEEESNRLFIDAYGLQNELSSEVPEDQITLARADREKDCQRLISYVIGCLMGRYSLDAPGLIYAHSGNVGFDPSRYERKFPADADGIVPITDERWFDDDNDAASRIREFLLAVWGADTLDENMAWLAESLGIKGNETSDETIRRYLAHKFFKDHLQTYKKRPIYWLFSSGKQGAFQALVYLHRYHEGTLARMRSEYVLPLTGKMQARMESLEVDIRQASSTAARNKLTKQLDALRKQHHELLAYDEKLRHYADQRIAIDLDDGVKVNYGKFGDLLAEVKAVTGGAADE